ncbi:MAG: hypothetical protein ACI97A_002504 [Planctomycetota bacterium]|jgi:hypothetical protein
MGRRSQSSKRPGSSNSRGSASGRGGNARRGGSSSNNTPMIIGGLALVAVIVIGFMMMDDSGGSNDYQNPEVTNTKASSTLDNKSNLTAPKKTTTPSKKSSKKKFDMAVLRPLAAKVDRSEWKKIDNYLSEAYKLKSEAEAARKDGNEATFKALMTKAVDTWRKGDMASENFLFEVDGLHDDLWDACFWKEKNRLKNALKAFRGFLGYESH